MSKFAAKKSWFELCYLIQYSSPIDYQASLARLIWIMWMWLMIGQMFGWSRLSLIEIVVLFFPEAPIFLSDLRFFGSMVPWFHGSISKCLAAAPVFLFRATRHFVLFSCEFKICAEVVVHRMFAVFLNSLNGKNSSRTIVRDIFSFFFLMLGFKISYSEYFLSHRLLSRESGL